MDPLDGKVAFITGAGRGLGRTIARTLAEKGASIVAVEIGRQIDTVRYELATIQDLEETRRLVEETGSRIVAMRGDVRQSADLRAAAEAGMEAFGRIDIVVANAGIGVLENDARDPEAVWQNILDVNLSGVWHTVEATKQFLIDGQRGGSIVLLSSTAGIKGSSFGSAGAAAYVASKTGVIGLMRSYAHELGPHSIRVNSVNPAAVDTAMTVNDAMSAWAAKHSGTASRASSPHLLPVSILEPVDVANAIAWLVSDAARYVTGVVLPVDAGSTAR